MTSIRGPGETSLRQAGLTLGAHESPDLEGRTMRRILTTAFVATSILVVHALPAFAGYINANG